MLIILKTKMLLCAVRSHLKQFTPFSYGLHIWTAMIGGHAEHSPLTVASKCQYSLQFWTNKRACVLNISMISWKLLKDCLAAQVFTVGIVQTTVFWVLTMSIIISWCWYFRWTSESTYDPTSCQKNKYPNWKLEYITACLTNTEFSVHGSDRKTFTALSGANCICKLCCYNQQPPSTYPIYTHIPNKFNLIQMLAKSFQNYLSNFNSFQNIS